MRRGQKSLAGWPSRPVPPRPFRPVGAPNRAYAPGMRPGQKSLAGWPSRPVPPRPFRPAIYASRTMRPGMRPIYIYIYIYIYVTSGIIFAPMRRVCAAVKIVFPQNEAERNTENAVQGFWRAAIYGLYKSADPRCGVLDLLPLRLTDPHVRPRAHLTAYSMARPLAAPSLNASCLPKTTCPRP